jgi:integrase
VIYEGRDPVTGKERRTWHPAGTDRAEAERLAAKLATTETNRVDAVRALTFGAYLTRQWLPAKKLHLATSTHRGYERNVQLHILPTLGKVAIRRLRYQQIEALHDTLLRPATGRGLAPKTVYEIHLVINGALADALRRGLVTRNVAVVARAPKQRSLQHTEGMSLTEDELRLLMRTGIPVKVVSERLGHANIAYTMQAYQHILLGMQADAARAAERLTRPVPLPADDTGETRRNQRRNTA